MGLLETSIMVVCMIFLAITGFVVGRLWQRDWQETEDFWDYITMLNTARRLNHDAVEGEHEK